jgi:hypothetical protein
VDTCSIVSTIILILCNQVTHGLSQHTEMEGCLLHVRIVYLLFINYLINIPANNHPLPLNIIRLPPPDYATCMSAHHPHVIDMVRRVIYKPQAFSLHLRCHHPAQSHHTYKHVLLTASNTCQNHHLHTAIMGNMCVCTGVCSRLGEGILI